MSLFNRPAWAASSTTGGAGAGEEGERNIFSHRNRFSGILADDERRRKEKAARKEAREARRAERRRSSEKRGREGEREEEGDGAWKKRRTTMEDGEKLLNSVGASMKTPVKGDGLGEGGVRRSPRKRKDERGKEGGSEPTDVVDVDGEEDEEDVVITQVVDAPEPEPDEEEDVDSDEELAALQRKARRERKEREERERRSAASDRLDSSGLGASGLKYRPPKEDEPVIQFYITSRLPETKPLIVHRRLSQRLDEVRKAWCAKQGYAKETWNNVFLVHRTRRLYNVNTPGNLVEVDICGDMYLKGSKSRESTDKVHLEAVTEEIYAQMLAEKEAEKRREEQERLRKEARYSFEDAGAGAAAPPEPIIRLVLRAKKQTDYKMKVKPHTTFAKIAAAYCVGKLKDDHASARLEFDGEALDPGAEVQSTDIEDMDCVDVVITA